MNWINQAWRFLRKLPIARYLRPLWKSGLSEVVVQFGGDELQKLVNAEIDKGVKGVSEKIAPSLDKLQRKAAICITSLPLPEQVEDRALRLVRDEIEALRLNLTGAVNAGSRGAVRDAADRAFDSFQERLKARIAAL